MHPYSHKKSRYSLYSLPLAPPACSLPQGRHVLNEDVTQRIMEIWGGMEFASFLNCVRESWRRTHARDETFPNAIAILLSSRRLASAIKAGWGQRGCMLAAATGNPVIFTEWQHKFGCTVIGGLLEAAVRGNNTTIVENVLEQYFDHDSTWDFPRDKDAYKLAVASGNAEMVGIVAAYVPHVDEGVTSDGLRQAAEVGDLGMAKVLWDSFDDQQSKSAVGGMSVAIEVAASHDHFEVAEWCVRTLHRSMDLCSRNVIEVIHHLCVWRPLVQWLHEEGCFPVGGAGSPSWGRRKGIWSGCCGACVSTRMGSWSRLRGKAICASLGGCGSAATAGPQKSAGWQLRVGRWSC